MKQRGRHRSYHRKRKLAIFRQAKGRPCQTCAAIIFIPNNQANCDKFSMPFQAKDKAAKILTPEFFSPIYWHSLVAIQPIIDMRNKRGIRGTYQIDKADKPSLSFKIEKRTCMELIYKGLSLRMLGDIHHLPFYPC